MAESTVGWLVLREKYCSLAEKIWLISQANGTLDVGWTGLGDDHHPFGDGLKKGKGENWPLIPPRCVMQCLVSGHWSLSFGKCVLYVFCTSKPMKEQLYLVFGVDNLIKVSMNPHLWNKSYGEDCSLILGNIFMQRSTLRSTCSFF